MIFIQIASYRDEQLSHTVSDCLDKAAFPDKLRFGIFEQRQASDKQHFLPKHCCHLKVDSAESLGVGWARRNANALYAGETYYLQIDSHTRFDRHWDYCLRDQLHECEVVSKKAVLTAYPNSFEPGYPDAYGAKSSLTVVATGFHTSGLLRQEPRVVDFGQRRAQKARCVAAGFLFARGSFVADVKYDPNVYFIGEEPILAVQAYTRGYDLYHPYDCPIYHFYTRAAAPHHWSDYSERYVTLVANSDQYVNTALASPGYFGTDRTLAEYQAYSGIDFAARTLSERTKAGLPPE